VLNSTTVTYNYSQHTYMISSDTKKTNFNEF